MSAIAGSTQTLQAGQAGAWFTVAGTSFLADVDNSATVYLETRRDSGDTAAKLACGAFGKQLDAQFSGPCSVVVQSVANRQYRFVCVAGPANVAADQ